jgi:hypothetical protein
VEVHGFVAGVGVVGWLLACFASWCYLAWDRCFVVLAEDMLFMELPKAENDSLWRSDMTGNKPELEIGCFGKVAMDIAKGRMESIDFGVMVIALCGLHLWLMIAAKAAWSLVLFFF